MKLEYSLEPRYDSRKSFYGKATVIETDLKKQLRSYSTIVAEIKPFEFSSDGTPFLRAYVYGWYSGTTGRHIKEFLKQNGFRADNKAQILKDYYAEEY